MTSIQQCSLHQLPSQITSPTARGGGDVGKVQQNEVGQAPPTAGSPVQQHPREQSWLSRNIKLVGILGGAAVGGAIGFLTLGPIGGLGGAAVGALAGYMLTKNRATGGGASAQQLPPPLPDISAR